jgi:hypothetical protein
MTVGPDNSLWFTEVFASKIGRLDTGLHLHEYMLPFAGTPAQVVFVNNNLCYYVDTGNIGLVKPAVYSFDPSNISLMQLYSELPFQLRSPTSLALVAGGVWVAQHATSNLAYYNMSSQEWTQFPTSPVNYEETTLPYFVAANGSLIWFNEHYANRLAKIDTVHGLLTEYSLSDPPASNITSIGNALTFALGKDKVWFTELTANQVGYVDASYQPNFTVTTPNSSIKLRPGENVNVTLTINGQSAKPLTVQFADTENYTSRPERIIMNATQTKIRSLTGQYILIVTVATDKGLRPGNYTLLVTVTDQLTYQGTYIKLQLTT